MVEISEQVQGGIDSSCFLTVTTIRHVNKRMYSARMILQLRRHRSTFSNTLHITLVTKELVCSIGT